MLLNLQPLDIGNSQHKAHQNRKPHKSHPSLHIQPSAKRMPRNHQRAHKTHYIQQHSQVPGDAVHEDPLVAHERRKLQHGEKTCGKDACKVQGDADSIPGEVVVVVAFSRRGTVARGGHARAEVCGEVEVHEASECEAEECAGENEPQNEIVRFAEAEGIVDATGPGVEGVFWRTGWCGHSDDGGEVWSVGKLAIDCTCRVTVANRWRRNRLADVRMWDIKLGWW